MKLNNVPVSPLILSMNQLVGINKEGMANEIENYFQVVLK